MFCQHCGTKTTTSGQRFCQECGGEINQAASARIAQQNWSAAPGTTNWNGARIPFALMGSPVYIQATRHHPLRALLLVMAVVLLLPFVAIPVIFGSLFAGFALLHGLAHIIPTV